MVHPSGLDIVANTGGISHKYTEALILLHNEPYLNAYRASRAPSK